MFAIITVAMKRSSGFTIIEILVVIAIMAILASLAIPSYLDFFEKGRVRGATEAVYEQLQYARAQALKRSVPIIVDFSADGSTTWYLGITDDLDGTIGCDATITSAATANACTIEYDNDTTIDHGGDGVSDKILMRLASTDFSNISMSAPLFDASSSPGACATTQTNEACFEPIQGLSRKTKTTAPTGHIELSNGDYKLQVRVDKVRGVKICRPTDSKYFVGYNECP